MGQGCMCPACRAFSSAEGASYVELRPRRRARPARTPVCREFDPEATGSLGVRAAVPPERPGGFMSTTRR